MSSTEPGEVQYAVQISSPTKGVQPITYVYSKFGDIMKALELSVEEINREQIEVAFHENTVVSLEKRLIAHKERLEQIANGGYDADDVEMEEV